ncbi:hypothetical protein ACSYAD_30440 [Acaryochloris marina NIES-2412]|uniref:hypothetical protein n=1 Tax=Acaryochloris marina TaxID=155978 RepID=UPI00405982A4
MTVSIPPLTLRASTPQTNVTSYSTNSDDNPILDQFAFLLPNLSQDELAGLSIIALDRAFEPEATEVEHHLCNTQTFYKCTSLIRDLSQAGKVALVRSIAEQLAVSLGIAPDADKPTSPTLPPVPPPCSENAWGQLSLEHAIAFSKAGLLDPAIIAWAYPSHALQMLPSEMLTTATERFPDLLAALQSQWKPQ